MKQRHLSVFALIFALAAIAAAPPPRTDEEKIARIHHILFNTIIDTRGIPQKTTLAKFLTTLQANLPVGKKFSLRLDDKAFGKQLPRLAATEVDTPVVRLNLAVLLRKILARVEWLEKLDFAIRPTGIEITRPRLAAHRVVYAVRDILEQPRLLRANLSLLDQSFEPNAKANGPDLLVQFLFHDVNFQSWEAVEILNDTRLAVLCSPTRHEEVANLLGAIRRVADTAVVMNARLYEVDRAFYSKNVAPLFARHKGPGDQARVLPIDEPLLKQILSQKLLLESEEERIQPHQESVFLSRRSAFRFARKPRTRDGRKRISTGLAGVSFSVRPLVSADRRFLRLQITQQVTRLVRIDKSKTLDFATGKEVEFESPNLSRTSVTGTVQIPDASPILMPVAYRPADKGSSDKVWLLVARPFIWIEVEVKELRSEGGDLSGKSIWKSLIPKEEEVKAKPIPPLPSSDAVRQILQGVLTDVLTNKKLKDTRDFYGTSKDRTFTLVDGDKLGWPRHFKPKTHGFKQVEVKHNPFNDQPRVLGVRLDKFDLKQKKADLMNAPIEVCLFNAGGSANGGVIGGCLVYQVPKRVGKRWTVEMVGLLDP